MFVQLPAPGLRPATTHRPQLHRSSGCPERAAPPRRTRRSTLSVLLLLLLLALGGVPAPGAQEPAPAADPDDDQPRAIVEDTVTVSANAVPVPLRSAGSSVTVIEAEEIERRDKVTLAELLRTVPGLEVTRTGGPGKATSVRLRGGDASHTLVLLDGVRINATTTGDVDFAELTTDNLERIEVLRGPQAAYGSEALSGVISIVTARGEGSLHGRLTGEAGNLDTRRLLGTLASGSGRFDYSASLSDLSTEGVSHSSERAGNREPDPYDNRTLTGRLGLGVLGDGRLELSLRSFTGDNALDGFSGDDLNARAESQGLSAALALHKTVNRTWSQTLQLGTARHDLEGIDPDTPFHNYRIQSEALELRGQSDLRLGSSDTLSLGYSVEERQAENRGSFEESVTLSSVWLHNLWSPDDRFHLSGALRFDDHTTFAGETSWRLTASFAPHPAARLHASLGTAFRAPDMNELYFPFAGNPSLLPERARGFDLGVEGRWLDSRLSVDLTWFATDFEDLIVFDLGTFTFANVAAAESQGLEVVMALELGARRRQRIDLSHSYNRTEDLASGLPLPRRPRHRSTLSFFFAPLPRLDGVLTAFSVRDRIDSNGQTMDGYLRTDLGLHGRLGRFGPYLRIENLLDRDYEEVTGFTTPGRVAVLGLRVEL